jgi:hypothetical protein
MIELFLAAAAVLQKAPSAEQQPAVGKEPAAGQQQPAPQCVEVPEPGQTGARSLAWYINSEPAPVGGETFVKYGLPRVLAAWEVEFYRASRGGYFYVEAGSQGEPEIVYLLTDLAGCEFQPYQRES